MRSKNLYEGTAPGLNTLKTNYISSDIYKICIGLQIELQYTTVYYMYLNYKVL